MKRFIHCFSLSLFLFVLVSGWSMCGQTYHQESVVDNSAAKGYHSPSFYATASIIPGLGQYLLGEPKKGTTLVLLNLTSIAASAGGYTAVAMRQRPKDQPQLNETVTNLWGILAIVGNVGWLATEIYSVADAYKTAKRKLNEVSLRPVILYNPVSGSGSEAFTPGIGLAFRF